MRGRERVKGSGREKELIEPGKYEGTERKTDRQTWTDRGEIGVLEIESGGWDLENWSEMERWGEMERKRKLGR